MPAEKVCSLCNNQKPADQFGPGKARCKTCRAGSKRGYYKLNAESCREYSSRYFSANRAEELEKKKVRYAENRDAISARQQAKYQVNPAASKDRVKRWRADNPDKRAAQSRRRRAAGKGVRLEKFTPMEIFERDLYICYICGGATEPVVQGKRNTPLAPTLDHIIPLSKRGPHTRDNVTCAHKRCNTRRGTRDWFRVCYIFRHGESP